MSAGEAVCRSDAVRAGALTPVICGRARVLLTRLGDGRAVAIADRCPHHGAALAQGQVTCRVVAGRRDELLTDRPGEILRCPWHGFEFDLATGDPLVPPPTEARMRLRFFTVDERDGEIHVRPG